MVHGGFVADHMALLGMLRPRLYAQRQSIGLTREDLPCRARWEAWLPRNSSTPPSGEVCCQSSTQASVRADRFFACRSEFHVFKTSFTESQ